jgi:hypothetical protein
MMDNSFCVLYFMSPEFSVQKFPTQIIKFCVALITKIIRQGEQEGFLKKDRMNKICRMHMTTILLSCNPVQTAPCKGPRKPSCNPVQKNNTPA